jgi:hypothetical protein
VAGLAFVDLASNAAKPWGVLTPWALIDTAAVAIATWYRQGAPPPFEIVDGRYKPSSGLLDAASAPAIASE